VRGFSNVGIAEELCISIKTVETHRTRINRKLSAHGTADLIRYAAQHGLALD
jgi:DNA-binding NarL/FixJ family response regulator